MLESLITSKTRIKLMLKFFLNSNNSAHLRGLESEFGESTNGIRIELNRFEQAGLLRSYTEGNRKVFTANIKHPLFIDIQHLMHKHIGLDQIIEQITEQIGELERVYLTGAFARGQESSSIEVLLIGGNINFEYIEKLITKASKAIKRNIVYQVMDLDQFNRISASPVKEKFLLLWQNNA
jgi:hypothetical protein